VEYVRIMNRARRVLVVVLDHNTFCRGAGKCYCCKRSVITRDDQQGERRTTKRSRMVPDSLTILGRETVVAPRALLELPLIKAGLSRGELVVLP